MSNIPLARTLLLEIADSLPAEHARRVREVVQDHLFREPFVRRVPDKSNPITDEVRRQIIALARTRLPMSEIGHRLGVNQGRVSEVLTGKR